MQEIADLYVCHEWFIRANVPEKISGLQGYRASLVYEYLTGEAWYPVRLADISGLEELVRSYSCYE